MNSIIFVHKGNPFYLQIALSQARKTNPQTPIVLLGDETNKDIPGITHFYINDFFCRAQKFGEIYVNNSPNSREYELFCFQRWMVIWEFLNKNVEYNDKFLYCDSDTLLFADVTSEFERMGNKPMAYEYKGSPAFTFVNKNSMGEFCNLIEWFYTSAEGLKLICQYKTFLVRNSKKYGISDMSVFAYYKSHVHPGLIIEPDKPVNNGWLPIKQDSSPDFLFCYDHNYGFSLEQNIYVLFKGVHFQGRHSKYEMIKYAKKNLKPFSKLWRMYYIHKIKRYALKFKVLLTEQHWSLL